MARASLPVLGSTQALHPSRDRRPDPTAARCLRCQLTGRRLATCSKRDDCIGLPHSFLLGPALIVAWLATAIAFVVSVW